MTTRNCFDARSELVIEGLHTVYIQRGIPQAVKGQPRPANQNQCLIWTMVAKHVSYIDQIRPNVLRT